MVQLINMIHHIKRMKNKTHMTISINSGKTFEKIQQSFMIKTLNKLGTEGMHLGTIKGLYYKTTANLILTREKLKAFPLRSRTKQGCPLLTLQYCIQSPSQRNWTRERNGKKEIKLPQFLCMIIYTENPKYSTKKLLELISLVQLHKTKST
jgi:hypothetical protein